MGRRVEVVMGREDITEAMEKAVPLGTEEKEDTEKGARLCRPGKNTWAQIARATVMARALLMVGLMVVLIEEVGMEALLRLPRQDFRCLLGDRMVVPLCLLEDRRTAGGFL